MFVMERLSKDLLEVAELLSKYKHGGQEQVVRQIVESLSTPNPDFKRLTGVDMWGGSGAVWETILSTCSPTSDDVRRDEKAFQEAIIRVAESLERLGIGTTRSRSIADTFLQWKQDKIFPWDSQDVS